MLNHAYRLAIVLLVAAVASTAIPFISAAVDTDDSNAKETPKDTSKDSNASADKVVPNAALEALVKASNFNYLRMANGNLEIIADNGDDPLVVIGYEAVSFTMKTGEQKKIAIIVFKALSLDAEKAAKPPLPLVMHVNDLNNRYHPGKFCILTGQNPGLYFESSFWLSPATSETIQLELTNAYLQRKVLRKEMEPYLKGDAE